jgi:mannose-1-phosphate guanylyltransferase
VQTDDARPVWAIVLAGGEGMRLRPLIRHIHGDDRPKQFACVLGSRSMLRDTLDRTSLGIAAERTVIVGRDSHARFLASESDVHPLPRVLVQPEDRGTALGVLLPVYWIAARDRDATVAVFPSDHFVADARLFMAHVLRMASWLAAHPRAVVLVGAQPTGPDPQYGWIEPGEPIDAGANDVLHVCRFWEKPSLTTAQAAFALGWLWNTFVILGRVGSLIDLAARHLPRVHARLLAVQAAASPLEEARAIEQAYADLPKESFSRAVLEQCPPELVVSRLPPVMWSDCGTPDRVFRSLRMAGQSPAWLTCLQSPLGTAH